VQRKFRLTRSTDFKRVRRDGRSNAHPLIVLIASENQLSITRVGVAAGKRVGNAVYRNRAKRLMRAAAREVLPNIKTGWDLIIIARKPIIQSKMPQVRDALEQLLKRAQLTQDV
jgi:ribonuclease P protein component